jgi:hypothetical protein
MRVWVNTTEGWVQHGGVRKSPARATIVARLLARRLGWETASGTVAPPVRPASPGAPTAARATVSPAWGNATSLGVPSNRVPEDAGVPGATADGLSDGALTDEPYLEELASFALEAQLRDFIVTNIARVPVGATRLRVYRDPLGRSGSEYPTAVGPIDILAVDDSGNFFVIELKLDRGPDRVLGQLARYMGWVKANLALHSEVRGVVVARSIDQKLRYAAGVMPNVTLLEYEIDFKVREVASLSARLADSSPPDSRG